MVSILADLFYTQKEDELYLEAKSLECINSQKSILQSEKSLLRGSNSEYVSIHEKAEWSWNSTETHQEPGYDLRWVRTSACRIFIEELPFFNSTLKTVSISENLRINLYVPTQQELMFPRRKKKKKNPTQSKRRRISLKYVPGLTSLFPPEKDGNLKVETPSGFSKAFSEPLTFNALLQRDVQSLGVQGSEQVTEVVGGEKKNGRKKLSVFCKKRFLCCIRPPSDLE